MMFKRLAIGIAAVSLLSGCAVLPWNWTTNDPWDYKAVSKMPCTGTAFDCALQTEYVDLADYEYRGEYSGGDWDSVQYYTDKARMAAEGRTPVPTVLSTVDTGAYAPELTTARADLVQVLGTSAPTNHPQVAARAQVSFDCWVEESSENRQPIRIQECRANFDEAMRTLRGLPVASTGIHFASGSTALDAEGIRTIEQAVAQYRSATQNGASARLIVTGHTDTVGNPRNNLLLSQRRADAVVKALEARGVPSKSIVTRAEGETGLAVRTGNQVANRANRRVDITLER